MYLEELVGEIELENTKIECKALLDKTNVEGWLKSIAGFANCSGGTFYIGVEDKTNQLIGFNKKDADNTRNYFNNQVNEHIFPRPEITFNFIAYKARETQRFIIQAEIKESPIKPVILKYKGVPCIYMRRDGFTNGATYEEIINMSIKSQNKQYDILFSDYLYNREDFKTLFDFYESHNPDKELTDKALKSIGFFSNENKLANGAVLFMDDYSGDKTTIQCSVFSGINKGSQRIVTVNKYHGNLINTLRSALDFVKQRMNHSIIKLGTSRKNIDAFPERALFEGLINALAHRDYFLDGTQIQIDIFLDRLEISSPGSFYQGNEISKTYDLSSIISKRRNELICNILVKCNVMEAAGTGFDKITEEYKDVDSAHKPYIASYSDHFTLVLPDLTYSQGLSDSEYPAIAPIPIENPSIHDEKILSFCYNQARKAQEIAEYLNLGDSTYFRHNILENLVKKHYLEKSTQTRTAYYKTNQDLVPLL